MKILANSKMSLLSHEQCFCAAVLLAGLLGCGGEQGKPGETKVASKGTIGVSVLNMRNPFFLVIAENIKTEAKKAGYDTIITDGDMKVDEQRRQVQSR